MLGSPFFTPGIVNPMTTQYDLIVGGTAGAPTRLAKGSNGDVLTTTAGVVAWAAPAAAGMTNPMTTAGDLILGGASGTPGRLAIGATAGMYLRSNGTTAAWSLGPLTTTGDLLVGATGAEPVRLAVGATGAVLTVAGATATWAVPQSVKVYSVNPAATFTTTSATMVAATGYSVAMTPANATNEIIVEATVSIESASANTGSIQLELREGATVIRRSVINTAGVAGTYPLTINLGPIRRTNVAVAATTYAIYAQISGGNTLNMFSDTAGHIGSAILVTEYSRG